MQREQFKNRTEAGKMLARTLEGYTLPTPLILALPRGGVPVGYEVAKILKVPFDTRVVRKIGAPGNPEFGVGAIAKDIAIFDEDSLSYLGLTKEDLRPIIEHEKREMERRSIHYKSGEYAGDKTFETVIVVDDGLATGVSAQAAIASVRQIEKPKRIIFATPIAASDTVRMLRREVEIIAVREVDNLIAIGYWYEYFPQTTDEEVLKYLEMAKQFQTL